VWLVGGTLSLRFELSLASAFPVHPTAKALEIERANIGDVVVFTARAMKAKLARWTLLESDLESLEGVRTYLPHQRECDEGIDTVGNCDFDNADEEFSKLTSAARTNTSIEELDISGQYSETEIVRDTSNLFHDSRVYVIC
jgi:hypothetical protein